MALAVSSSSWGEEVSSVSSTATMDAASLSAAAKAAAGAMFSAIANVRNTARIRFMVHNSFLFYLHRKHTLILPFFIVPLFAAFSAPFSPSFYFLDSCTIFTPHLLGNLSAAAFAHCKISAVPAQKGRECFFRS